MRRLLPLLLASCGLRVVDVDAAAVQRGADVAVARWPEAAPIVERLDVFGYPVADVPRQCRLTQFRRVEGCALRPGSTFPGDRAAIVVANDVDDIEEITTAEIGHLVFFGEPHGCEPHGCDPLDLDCLADHKGEP